MVALFNTGLCCPHRSAHPKGVFSRLPQTCGDPMAFSSVLQSSDQITLASAPSFHLPCSAECVKRDGCEQTQLQPSARHYPPSPIIPTTSQFWTTSLIVHNRPANFSNWRRFINSNANWTSRCFNFCLVFECLFLVSLPEMWYSVGAAVQQQRGWEGRLWKGFLEERFDIWHFHLFILGWRLLL